MSTRLWEHKLFDCIDWLIDWRYDWSIDGWIDDWLTNCMIDWLMCWLIDGVMDWMIDWVYDWLFEWSNIDWFSFHLIVDPGTKFTKEPSSPVYGIQGSNVTFHWTLAFGNIQDWNGFIELFWGSTIHKNYNGIDEKYVTVKKNSKTKNPALKAFYKSRVDATLSNCSQSGCDVIFVIQSVTVDDAKYAYNCRADVHREDVKSSPISLVMSGNS